MFKQINPLTVFPKGTAFECFKLVLLLVFLVVMTSVSFSAKAFTPQGDAYSVSIVSSTFCGAPCVAAAPVVLRGAYCGMPSNVSSPLNSSSIYPIGNAYSYYMASASLGASVVPIVYPYMSTFSRLLVLSCSMAIVADVLQITQTFGFIGTWTTALNTSTVGPRLDTVVFAYTPIDELNGVDFVLFGSYFSAVLLLTVSLFWWVWGGRQFLHVVNKV